MSRNYRNALVRPAMRQPVEVPADQAGRDEAFSRAVRAGDSRTAAWLAHAEPPPADATEDQLSRWKIRRRLYALHELPGAP